MSTRPQRRLLIYEGKLDPRLHIRMREESWREKERESEGTGRSYQKHLIIHGFETQAQCRSVQLSL